MSENVRKAILKENVNYRLRIINLKEQIDEHKAELHKLEEELEEATKISNELEAHAEKLKEE